MYAQDVLLCLDPSYILPCFRLQFFYGTLEPEAATKLGYTDSGYQVQVTLVSNEYIQDIDLDFTVGKSFLSRMVLKTNLRTFGPYGGEGALEYRLKGSKLLYIEGKSGPLINQLTIYYDQCS